MKLDSSFANDYFDIQSFFKVMLRYLFMLQNYHIKLFILEDILIYILIFTYNFPMHF